jgi:hypothetical protein
MRHRRDETIEEGKGEAIIFFVFLVCDLWVGPIPRPQRITLLSLSSESF